MFGIIACIIITIAYLPQCYNIYKTNNINGLSINTFLAILIGMIFWITHAIIIKDNPLIISSLMSLLQNSYIVYKIIKIKFCTSGKNSYLCNTK